MAALPQDDFTKIGEPRTNREVLQQIVHMIEADREDRADDRELLESFITAQKELNEKITVRVRLLEDASIAVCKDIDQLREHSKKWDLTNSIGALIALLASILAALGLTGS